VFAEGSIFSSYSQDRQTLRMLITHISMQV